MASFMLEENEKQNGTNSFNSSISLQLSEHSPSISGVHIDKNEMIDDIDLSVLNGTAEELLSISVPSESTTHSKNSSKVISFLSQLSNSNEYSKTSSSPLNVTDAQTSKEIYHDPSTPSSGASFRSEIFKEAEAVLGELNKENVSDQQMPRKSIFNIDDLNDTLSTSTNGKQLFNRLIKKTPNKSGCGKMRRLISQSNISLSLPDLSNSSFSLDVNKVLKEIQNENSTFSPIDTASILDLENMSDMLVLSPGEDEVKEFHHRPSIPQISTPKSSKNKRDSFRDELSLFLKKIGSEKKEFDGLASKPLPILENNANGESLPKCMGDGNALKYDIKNMNTLKDNYFTSTFVMPDEETPKLCTNSPSAFDINQVSNLKPNNTFGKPVLCEGDQKLSTHSPSAFDIKQVSNLKLNNTFDKGTEAIEPVLCEEAPKVGIHPPLAFDINQVPNLKLNSTFDKETATIGEPVLSSTFRPDKLNTTVQICNNAATNLNSTFPVEESSPAKEILNNTFSPYAKNHEVNCTFEKVSPAKSIKLNETFENIGNGSFIIEGNTTNLMDMQDNDLEVVLQRSNSDLGTYRGTTIQSKSKKKSLLKRLSVESNKISKSIISEAAKSNKEKIPKDGAPFNTLPTESTISQILRKNLRTAHCMGVSSQSGPMKAIPLLKSDADSGTGVSTRAVSTPVSEKKNSLHEINSQESRPTIPSFGSISTIDSDRISSMEMLSEGTPEVFRRNNSGNPLTSTPAVGDDIMRKDFYLEGAGAPTPIAATPVSKGVSRASLVGRDLLKKTGLIGDVQPKLQLVKGSTSSCDVKPKLSPPEAQLKGNTTMCMPIKETEEYEKKSDVIINEVKGDVCVSAANCGNEIKEDLNGKKRGISSFPKSEPALNGRKKSFPLSSKPSRLSLRPSSVNSIKKTSIQPDKKFLAMDMKSIKVSPRLSKEMLVSQTNTNSGPDGQTGARKNTTASSPGNPKRDVSNTQHAVSRKSVYIPKLPTNRRSLHPAALKKVTAGTTKHTENVEQDIKTKNNIGQVTKPKSSENDCGEKKPLLKSLRNSKPLNFKMPQSIRPSSSRPKTSAIPQFRK